MVNHSYIHAIDDYIFPEAMKYFFMNPTVVLYITGSIIFLTLFIVTLRLLVKWSDDY